MCDRPVCNCSSCLEQRRKAICAEQNLLDANLAEAIEKLTAERDAKWEALDQQYWAISKQQDDLDAQHERETSKELQ